MNKKDWILLILPTVLNGGFLFYFQKVIEKRLENINKRNSLRDKIILEFYGELQKLNTIFIEVNINAQQNPESISLGLNKIINQIILIIKFYDANIYDLEEFEKEYDSFNKAWNDFMRIYEKNVGRILVDSDRRELGEKMQISKDKLKELSNKVREKY